MGIKRVVDMDFWTDEMVLEDFSPEDKLFFLYLLTNPHSSMLGVYKIIPKQMAFELGYSIEAVKVFLDRFENKYGVIKYSLETKEIAVKNYLHYGIVSGGKPVFDRLTADMKNVRDLELLKFILGSVETRQPENDTVKKFIVSLKEYLSIRNVNVDENVNVNGNGNGDGESYHDSSNDSSYESSPPPSPSIPYEKIKNLYNEICKSFSKCNVMSDARKKAVKARISSGYTLEHFKTLFTKAEASSFLKGRNDRNWKASFDWLIKDANMAKVLDGNYDDHGQPSYQNQSTPRGGNGFQTSNPFLEMLNEEREGR